MNNPRNSGLVMPQTEKVGVIYTADGPINDNSWGWNWLAIILITILTIIIIVLLVYFLYCYFCKNRACQVANPTPCSPVVSIVPQAQVCRPEPVPVNLTLCKNGAKYEYGLQRTRMVDPYVAGSELVTEFRPIATTTSIASLTAPVVASTAPVVAEVVPDSKIQPTLPTTSVPIVPIATSVPIAPIATSVPIMTPTLTTTSVPILSTPILTSPSTSSNSSITRSISVPSKSRFPRNANSYGSPLETLFPVITE